MASAVSRLLLDWMSEHDRELVELLERLAGAESPSLDPASQHGPFGILVAELERIGYQTRPVRGFGVGDHLYARPRQRCHGVPRQLLIGHMDTVWPIGTIAAMPLHEEGGLLFGPGVADMKGGLVEIVFALRALHELELRPSVTPVVFVNTDEEIGSIDSYRHLRLLAQGAERAFVLESGEGADGKLKIARKGLGHFTLTVHGRSSHAGADPEHGVSAILELAHQVQRLFAFNDPTQGVTVNVGTIDGGLRPNVVAAGGERDHRRARADDGRGSPARAGRQRPAARPRGCHDRGRRRLRPPSDGAASAEPSSARDRPATRSASWACRSRTRASSGAARTRTRPASSRPRSTGSGRSVRARMPRTSESIPPAYPNGRRSWRCCCSSRSADRGAPRASRVLTSSTQVEQPLLERAAHGADVLLRDVRGSRKLSV